jgi:DNA-binding CsgD family transcriptional regulator
MTAVPPVQRSRRVRASAAGPLLDRDAELASLRAVVESARSGDGQLVVIEGDAGIGKTRLLTEVRSLAAEFDVLSARAGELETDFAFGIVRQLFEGALVGAPGDVRNELLSGAAALAGPLFTLVPGEVEPGGGETSFAMLHGLYWLAANFALRGPTLLIVDDLHWADEPSLRWLGYLARRLEGLPLLVVAATRPPEHARAQALVTEIVGDPLAIVIRPAALSRESSATLAEVLFGLQADAAFAAALRDASGGNPLYLAAILDAVARQQISPTAEEAPRLLELGGEAISRGVGLRLSRLSVEAVALVRAAAILGDRTELALAASFADLEPPAALNAAALLVRANLLHQDSPILFSHPIVRSAVLADMNTADRMHAYRRAAETLLEAGAPPERAATYLMSAMPVHDGFVVATLRRAAERSQSQGAPDAAIAYLQRALEEPPAKEDRPDVLGALGIAESHAFKPDAAIDHLAEALAEFDDIARRPDLVLAYVMALTSQADSTRAGFELLALLSDNSQSDRSLQERVAAQLINAAHYDPTIYPVARERWDAISPNDGADPIEAGPLLAVAAYEESRRGVDRERTVALANRAIATEFASTGEHIALINAPYALVLSGYLDEAATALDDFIDQSRRAGDRVALAAFCLWAGRVHTERGKLLAAEEILCAPEVVSFAVLPLPFAYRGAFLAEALLLRGETDEAAALLGKVRFEEILIGHRVPCLYSRGHHYLETGRPEQALTDLRNAGKIAASIGIENPAFAPWRSQAALALHRLGRAGEAVGLARDELELSRRWGAPHTIGVSLRALGLVEGGARGEQLLREAAGVLGDSPARLEHARTLIDLGAALRRANSRSEARKHLREGVDLAHQCGAAALVSRGNEELAATGAHPRKVMLSGLESLTASERRVAQMAAEDVSNKEIAQALFVTVKTVEVHLSRVYRKLDIESRRQLAGALSAPAVNAAVGAR